jgi:hypothetical protein
MKRRKDKESPASSSDWKGMLEAISSISGLKRMRTSPRTQRRSRLESDGKMKEDKHPQKASFSDMTSIVQGLFPSLIVLVEFFGKLFEDAALRL